ncbi:amino acid synthesis family protein [Paraburkholderia tropica]|uniref:amino acid synthesis family protein n=1 Tax=Paraburkholderia tropica TaxID=92647 RepID=UPI0016044BE6|nr:amino acid synthesis family protein [Paraburkholderia tropica]QNB16111.1 amino acid synthesis family protein [Paraburkholderia tropica]
MNVQMTRIVIHLVERCAEVGTAVTPPHRQVVAAAVLKWADLDVRGELEALYATGAELGQLLTTRALLALGCGAKEIEGYGKAALAGTDVPLEWGAALLHPRLGKAVRSCLPGASSIMPSVTKRGAAGACVDIPLHGVTNMWSFDHFDTVSLCVPDSPAPDELLVAIALAERGRPLARIRPE